MGGQYGSEGKGEVAADIAANPDNYISWSIRTGGPNAGHTVTMGGKKVKMRHIPCAVVNPDVSLVLGPGALVSLEVLEKEIKDLREAGWWQKGRVLYVDNAATMIAKDAAKIEVESNMRERIGSTTEWGGAARAATIQRWPEMRASDESWREAWESIDIEVRFVNVADMMANMHEFMNADIHVLVESTQGFELSLRHSGHYPYATSTDLTPPQIPNDAGILFKTDYFTHIVCRAYPIRVAGNSGPLPDERTWEQMEEDTGGYVKADTPERTTVTNLPRRIAGWDSVSIRRMAKTIQPDICTLTFMDYIDPQLADPQSMEVSMEALGFIEEVKKDISPAKLVQISVGPGKLQPIA